jgi:hypothetical protein
VQIVDRVLISGLVFHQASGVNLRLGYIHPVTLVTIWSPQMSLNAKPSTIWLHHDRMGICGIRIPWKSSKLGTQRWFGMQPTAEDQVQRLSLRYFQSPDLEGQSGFTITAGFDVCILLPCPFVC